MRTRFSSFPSLRASRSVSRPVSDATPEGTDGRAHRTNRHLNRRSARRLTLALAASAPLCAGALWAGPAQAAPTVESDENGPLVQIVRPGYNDILKGKYRILIQVTARKYNPQSVEMFIDDVAATPGPLEISSFASSSYDFDTRSLTEGRHKLTVRVTDAQGFRGWSEVTVFVNNKGVVDTQVPDLRFVGIEPFQEFSGSMQIEVNAADDFGVKMLHISVKPADASSGKPYEWMMNQPPYKVNLDTIGKNIPDGVYVLKALAWDSLDQQGEAAPLTFGIVNNQINATRVQDMLDGQRQMSQVLAGEKLDAPAPQKTAPEAPAKVLPAAPEVAATPEVAVVPAPLAAPAVIENIAANAAQPVIEDAAPTRSSIPEAQIRPLPQTPPVLVEQVAPRVMPPSLNIAPPTDSNPGIQLPIVKTPAASPPQDATPRAIPQTETQNAPTTTLDETRVARIAPEESAPNSVTAPTEIAPTETTPTEAATPTESIAPSADVTPTETVAPGAAVAPQRSEEVRIATNRALPVNQRNGGQASLSRAAAIELAVAAPGGAVIESARSSQPIAIARFSRPNLSGRNVTDIAVLSQSPTGDESRLSNAELSRLRVGQTRILGAARPLIGARSEPANARALQISVPTLAQRPILGRAITAKSVSPPASRLTRQAQTPAPQKSSKPALSGSLSKTVLAGQRLAPIAPQTTAKNVAPAAMTGTATTGAASGTARGVIAKASESAPTSARLARNGAPTTAPQMSAPSAPRMSESASGQGIPARAAKPAPPENPSLDSQRVVALPRPGAVTSNRSGGALIVAAPLSGPFELADSTTLPVPTSYRAERNTTLRAIAARYGLPVELVAISNGLTTDAKVALGTEVKLPRPVQVSYNGAPVTGDAPSMLMGDTAVTAFRFMFEKSGGKMDWDAANQRVIASKDGREITLNIGSNIAKIGEREVAMEIAAFLFQGRTMVPLRLFEEGLNAQVEWNPQTGRLVVAMAG